MTQLRIISAYHDALEYVKVARTCDPVNLRSLWNERVLQPHWMEWAGGQFNEERTRAELETPPADLDALEQEARLLAVSGIEDLVRRAFDRITSALPCPMEDVAVCILPLDPANRSVLEQQNGVVGSCVGDHFLLQINPHGANWMSWVPYVMAHEYHHSVWGYHYFFLQGQTTMDLLTGLLVDGRADSFACSLFPGLKPAWLAALSPAQEVEQWKRMQPHLAGSDPEVYRRFFFGDAETDTPWCTAYTIGYHIAQAYLKAHAQISAQDFLAMSAVEILAGSRYAPHVEAE